MKPRRSQDRQPGQRRSGSQSSPQRSAQRGHSGAPRPHQQPHQQPRQSPPSGPDSASADSAQLHPLMHQHDLTPAAAAQVVAAAKLPKQATVFEPGAGTGRLTHELLAAGATVHAIELDRQRAAGLRTACAEAIEADRLTVLTGDARTLLPDLPSIWHLVANPPFMHSAELVRRVLLDDVPVAQPTSLTLLLQAQAVQKWCGGTGAARGHSRSSVLAHCFGRPQMVARMSRDAVSPPSHVDLAILRLVRAPDGADRHELARIDRLLERAFAGPRTVREALRGIATPAMIQRQGQEHGYAAQAHPRAVQPQAWRSMAQFLHSIGRLG